MSALAPKSALAFGAGRLYWSPLGTSLPSSTVVNSVFTDTTWTGWSLLGVTKEGHEFSYDIDTDTVTAAEYLDPLLTVTTGRTVSMSFELMNVHATNIKRALNGGTLTPSGSGTSQLNTYTPPSIGTEVRSQIGWQAEADDERIIALQTFQIGSLSIARKKGADVATLPVQFRFEPDSSGTPFTYYSAGSIRG
jgi:hypothetical protein